MKPFERIITHMVVATGSMNVLKSLIEDEELKQKIENASSNVKSFIRNYPLSDSNKRKYQQIVEARFDAWKPMLFQMQVNKIEISFIACAAFDDLFVEIPKGSHTYRNLMPAYEEFLSVSQAVDTQDKEGGYGYYDHAMNIVRSFTRNVTNQLS